MDKNLILLLGILLLWMVAIRNDITITKKGETTESGKTDTVNTVNSSPKVQQLKNDNTTTNTAKSLQQYAIGRSHAI